MSESVDSKLIKNEESVVSSEACFMANTSAMDTISFSEQVVTSSFVDEPFDIPPPISDIQSEELPEMEVERNEKDIINKEKENVKSSGAQKTAKAIALSLLQNNYFPHPAMLKLTEEDCYVTLRDKEVWAYRSLVEVFRAQGECSEERLSALRQLWPLLGISEKLHKSLVRSAIADNKLATISERIWGKWVDERWIIEGRQRPHFPMGSVGRVQSFSPSGVIKPIADEVSAQFKEKNIQLPVTETIAEIMSTCHKQSALSGPEASAGIMNSVEATQKRSSTNANAKFDSDLKPMLGSAIKSAAASKVWTGQAVDNNSLEEMIVPFHETHAESEAVIIENTHATDKLFILSQLALSHESKRQQQLNKTNSSNASSNQMEYSEPVIVNPMTPLSPEIVSTELTNIPLQETVQMISTTDCHESSLLAEYSKKDSAPILSVSTSSAGSNLKNINMSKASPIITMTPVTSVSLSSLSGSNKVNNRSFRFQKRPTSNIIEIASNHAFTPIDVQSNSSLPDATSMQQPTSVSIASRSSFTTISSSLNSSQTGTFLVRPAYSNAQIIRIPEIAIHGIHNPSVTPGSKGLRLINPAHFRVASSPSLLKDNVRPAMTGPSNTNYQPKQIQSIGIKRPGDVRDSNATLIRTGLARVGQPGGGQHTAVVPTGNNKILCMSAAPTITFPSRMNHPNNHLTAARVGVTVQPQRRPLAPPVEGSHQGLAAFSHYYLTQVSLAGNCQLKETLSNLLREACNRTDVPIQFSQIVRTVRNNLDHGKYNNMRQFNENLRKHFEDEILHFDTEVSQQNFRHCLSQLEEKVIREMLTIQKK